MGVVSVPGRSSYVVADLPGIIEGASEGVGLGDKFLKHATRTKIIAFVLDMSEHDGLSVTEQYDILKNELKNYSEKLYNKRSVIIANKMDVPVSKENLEKLESAYSEEEIIETSAVTRDGIKELILRLKNILDEEEQAEVYDKDEFESYVLYEFKNEKPYEIKKENEHTYIISGKKLEELLHRTRFNSDEAVLKFASKLKRLGIDEELKNLGAVDGDTVKILDVEFTYNENLDY